MADHAEREQTRIGADIELTPSDKYGVTLAYQPAQRRLPEPPVRGRRQLRDRERPAQGELRHVLGRFRLHAERARAADRVLHVREGRSQTNQWVTLTSGALNNLLRYVPSDKGNTFGVNGVFHLVPEKWTFSLLAQHQKVDGFLDITAREAGAFYNAGPHEAGCRRAGRRGRHQRLRRHEADDRRGGSRLHVREGVDVQRGLRVRAGSQPRTRSRTGRRSSRSRCCSSSRPTTATTRPTWPTRRLIYRF